MLETGWRDLTLTNQSHWWIIMPCNAITSQPSPWKDSLGAVKTNQVGVLEPAGKVLDLKKAGTSLLVE